MRQWLFRLFAFAVGAGLVYVLWLVVLITAVATGGGALICERTDDSCGGPVIDFINRNGTFFTAAAWATCLAGGALLAARSWRR